jgi:hypothetical protein
VIALRDLARFVDPSVVPSNPWRVIEDRKGLLSYGRDAPNDRPARSSTGARSDASADNAVGLAGESPDAGIDCHGKRVITACRSRLIVGLKTRNQV